MHGSAAPELPAYAGELARGRKRGLRPPTRAERRGEVSSCTAGLDHQPTVYVTDSWTIAKYYRQFDMAAVVIEPGPLYDFRWARGWIVVVLTRHPFRGLKEWIKEQGADLVVMVNDPDRMDEIEARARA